MEIIDYNEKYKASLIIFANNVFAENNIELDLNKEHIDFTEPLKYYCKFIVLIDEDDSVCGCLALRILDSYNRIAELKRLYLLSKYHNMGYGKKMFDLMIDDARKRGLKKIRLDTKERFSKAIALIESRDFYRIERYNNSGATRFYEKSL